MKRALTRFALKLLLRKCVPNQMPLGCEASLQNDYYAIRALGPALGAGDRGLLLKSIVGDTLHASSHDADQVHEHSLQVDRLSGVAWEITHYYRHWSIRLDDLWAAVLHELSKTYVLRWRRFAWRHARLSAIRDRYLVLEHLLALRTPLSRQGVSFQALLERQYGPLVMTSPRQSEFLDATLLVLESLKYSGDISYEGHPLVAKIQVNPQALATYSEYQLVAERFNSTLRLQRGQLLVGIGLIVVGAATALATILSILIGQNR